LRFGWPPDVTAFSGVDLTIAVGQHDLKLNVFMRGIKGVYGGGTLVGLIAWMVENEALSL